jgi:hypothetical protein
MYVFYQYHALESSIDSLPPVLRTLYLPVPAPGQDIIRVSMWRASGRSKLDLLDDDRLGQPGEYAALHDDGLSWGRDAAPSELV